MNIVYILAITTILDDVTEPAIQRNGMGTLEDYISAATASAAGTACLFKVPRPSHPANLGTTSIRAGSLSMHWVLFTSPILV